MDLTHFTEKLTKPLDLYTVEGRHAGQVRLNQIGPNTTVQIRLDHEEDRGWQDFMMLIVEGQSVRYGIITHRKHNATTQQSTPAPADVE